MITPEQKEIWTSALRSGEYTQGNGRLKGQVDQDKFEFCCLGVLQDVCFRSWFPTDFEDILLPTDIIPLEIQWDLATMNDGEQCGESKLPSRGIFDFLEIAAYIDDNYDKWTRNLEAKSWRL